MPSLRSSERISVTHRFGKPVVTLFQIAAVLAAAFVVTQTLPSEVVA